MAAVHSLRAGSDRFRVVVLAGLVIHGAVTAATAGQAHEAPTPQPTLAVQQAVADAFQTPEPTAAWQKEVAAAKARRSAGRKQAALGYGLAIVGDLILLTPSHNICPNTYSCSASTGPRLVGLPVIGLGLTAAILGNIKAHDADGEVNALIVRGPNRGLSQPSPGVGITIPAGGGRSLDLTIGSTRTLTYRVTW
jgi:hypothetical protein